MHMHRRDFVQLSLASLAASTFPRAVKSSETAKLRELVHSKGLFFGTAVSDSQLQCVLEPQFQ